VSARVASFVASSDRRAVGGWDARCDALGDALSIAPSS
jgi:hypothetical protein